MAPFQDPSKNFKHILYMYTLWMLFDNAKSLNHKKYLLKDERLEDFVLTKLDRKQSKPNNLEVLGHTFEEASNEIGNQHPYGSILAKVGDAEKKLGLTEREFVQKSSDCFLQPLKSFLDGQMKTIQVSLTLVFDAFLNFLSFILFY
jgi:hypothetical protein